MKKLLITLRIQQTVKIMLKEQNKLKPEQKQNQSQNQKYKIIQTLNFQKQK